MSVRADLFRHAARCYLAQEAMDDACRCFLAAGDVLHAAPLHEAAGRHLAAAEAYRQGAAWRDAARCFRQHGLLEDAAACLVSADDALEAAWLMAHEARRPEHAEALADEHASQGDFLPWELVRIRCVGGRGDHRQAGARLATLFSRRDTRFANPWSLRVLEWGLACTTEINRPDLAAWLFSRLQAEYSGFQPVYERWEAWAKATLGQVPALPTQAPASGAQSFDANEGT